MLALSFLSVQAHAQVSSPPTINGTFPIGVNNLAGSTSDTDNTASLPNLGLQNGVTFDFTGSISGDGEWNSGIGFNDASELNVQADNTNSPANSASYVFTFSETVYGFQVEKDGLDNDDRTVITFFNNGVQVPVDLSVVVDQGTNVNTALISGAIEAIGPGNVADEEFITINLPIGVGVDEVRFEPTHKDDPTDFNNVTLQYRDLAWATPDVALTKSSTLTGAPTSVGDIIEYTYVVTNNGQVPLTNVVVTETGFTGSDPIATPGFLSGTGGATPANLPQGETLTFTVSYAITAADIAAGSVDNQGTVSALPIGGTAGIDEVTDLSDSVNPGDGGVAGALDEDDPTTTTIPPAPVADVSVTLGAIPTVVSPGQVLTGLTITCENTGPDTALNATCLPTADEGVISNLACTPTTPADVDDGDNISCTFDYTAPGTAGGSDTTPTAIAFTGTASADNDDTPANNVDVANADLIDALDDATSETPGSTGNTFDLSTNDDVPVGSTFSIAPGSTCNSSSVSSAGVATFNATGTSCVVEYQVCAPAPNATVCDTATLDVSAVSALPPFACDGTTYQVFDIPANVSIVDLVNGEADVIGTLPTGVNATGFNMADGFAYGVDEVDLIRIGSNGASENLGVIAGIPGSISDINSGDFGPDGFLYVNAVTESSFRVIDVENVEEVSLIPWTVALGNVPDLAFIPSENAFFAVDIVGDNLNRIELDGTVTPIGSTGNNETFGAMYGDAAGNLFGIGNGSGLHYQFDLTTGFASVIGSSAPASSNDGFSCPGAVLDIPQADLVTVKNLSSGNPTPGEGDTVTFEIAITNNGPAIASDTTLTDLLPSGLTPTGNNGTTATGTYSTTTGEWDIGTINQGDTVTLTLEGTVDADQEGNTIQNITTAAEANQEDPTTVGDDLEESVVVGAADVSATFGAIPTVVSPGQALNGLTLTCENTGAVTATNADCVPTVDEGSIDNLVCTPATPTDVNNGDSISCTFDYTAPGTAGGSDTAPVAVEFTGTASADNDNTPANNVDTENADLIDAVDDTATPPSGSTGNTLDLGDNDQVPPGSAFSIAPGSTCDNSSVDAAGVATFDANPAPSCTVEYQVCAPAPNATVCDTATLTVTGEVADVSATFGSIPSVVSPGQVLTGLTLTCDNAGPDEAVIADCVPTVDEGAIDNLVCTPATPTDVNNGDSISCTFDYTAPGTAGGSDTAPIAVEFTGTASADNDNTPLNNVDTENADIIDAIDDSATEPAGATGSTFDLSINDEVPPGSTFSIAPGSTCDNPSVDAAGIATFDANPAPSCTVEYQVCAPAPNGGVCDTATLNVSVEVADISATFGPIPAVVSPGQTFTGPDALTLTCSNAGPSTAINVDCVPSVDEGTISNVVCTPTTPADINSGDDIACTFDYTAPGALGGLNTVPTAVNFIGTASADNDTTPANNVDTELATIIDAINDVATPPSGSTGNTLDLSTNDEVPPGSIFSIAPGSTCDNPSVDAAGIATFDANPAPSCAVEYQVCAPAPNASVCDTATLTVTGELADVSATFGPIPSVVSPGQVLSTLELTCSNAGPSTAINADCIPVVDEGSIDNLVCTPTTPTDVNNGDSISCTFDYTAPGTAGGEDTAPLAVEFTGTASADNDNTPANNVDTENAVLIDAVDDTATPPSGSTGNTLDLGDNDQVPPGSVFSIAPGSTCDNSSVDAAGVATFDANPAPSCTVEYQVCAPAPNDTVCDTATLTVTGEDADVSATFGSIPSVVNPGQVLAGLELTCANAGPSTALNADCVPTVDEGSIDNLVCTPTTPTSVDNGDSINCTFDYTAPGTAGGEDTAPLAVEFTGTASADNDNTPANNVDTENADLIDAVDDTATPPSGSTGNTLDLGDNDQVPPGSIFSIAPGSTCDNSSVDAAGVATFDANPAPSCTVEYQVCAPAPNDTVCDTATLTVTGEDADVSATFGSIPSVVNPGQVLAGLELTCANAGPSTALNADCVPTVDEGSIDNLVCTPTTPTSVDNGDSINCTFDYTAPGTAGGEDTAPLAVEFTGTASADNDNTPANNVDTENAELIDAIDDLATPPSGSTGNTFDLGDNDQVPPGSVFSIAPGSTCENASVDASGVATFDAVPSPSCTVEYQVCAPAPNAAVCDTATLLVDAPLTALDITKEITSIDDDSDGVSEGDQINYQITATNSGNTTLTNVVVSDPLITPDSITCDVLNAGETCVLSGLYEVTAADALAGVVLNIASVTSTEVPGPTDSPEISVPIDPLPAALSGSVFLDENVNDIFDGGELPLVDWIIEVILDGQVVGTTSASGDGSYGFTDLVPADNYEIQLRHPDTNVAFGLIDGVELVSGQNLLDQNIPVDPSGVVYDSENRTAIEGVIATITDSTGTPLPDACLLPDQQNQTTAADGFYRFDLIPDADPACPSGGTFNLEFVAPDGFNDAPSTSILPEVGTFDPTGLGDPVQIQPQGTPPAIGEDTTYFLSFEIENGDPNVIFNHVPLDPIGATELQLTKTADQRTASIGELVRYQVAVENTGSSNLVGLTLIDTPPPGFRFVEGSQTINVDGVELTATGDSPFTIGSIDLAVGQTAIVSYILRIGAGITRGEYINTVSAELGGTAIGNTSTASVEIVADPDFEETTIIGKVFNDKNGDGWQDDGEIGIPGVRLVTVTGLLIETDSQGRYHIAGVDVERFERGRNFYLKLDTATLPDGAEVVTENPRVMRITQGLKNQINFGVRLLSQEDIAVEVEVGELLFISDSVSIRDEHKPLLDQMAAHVREYQGGQLSIVGRAGTEALALQRAELLRNELMSRLEGYDYPVDVSIRTEASEYPLASVGYDMTIYSEFFFDTFKYDISASQREVLKQLAEQLKNNCAADVLIEGHTDIRNKSGINNELSKNRARVIYEALRDLGAFSRAGETCGEPVNTGPANKASNDQSRINPPADSTNNWVKAALSATFSFFIAPAYADSAEGVHSESIDISKADINQDLCSVQHCETDEGVVVKILGRAATKERTPGSSANQLKDNRRTDVTAQVAADGRDVSTITGLMFTQLNTGGTLWLTEDPLVVEPKFAFSTPYGVKDLGQSSSQTMRFEFYTNYAAFQDRLELVIYDYADQDQVEPVAILNAEPNMFGEFVWQPQEVVGAGDRFFAYVKVFDKDGNLDFTTSRDFEIFDYDALTKAEKESHEQNRPFVSVYGRTDLAQQRMPLNGSLVRVHGDVKGRNPDLRINDQFVPVDADNEFAVEYLVPVGQHDFDIEVTPQNGQPESRSLQADVSGEYIFFAGLADITASGNSISGSAEPLSVDDRFDDDFLVDGRLAFYLKGKIKGKYLLTAQLDTEEDEIGDIFTNIFDKDDDSVFRRLDPDLYYPLYGDDSTTISDTDSQGRFFVRLDWNQNQVLWGNYNTGLTGTEFAQYNRSLYGARAEHISLKVTDLGEAKTNGKVFLSETQTAFGHAEFLGTGGSLYYLPNTDILPGSEKVTVEIRDRDSNLVVDTLTLQRDRDYEIDEIQGRIILVRPLSQIQARQQSIVRDDALDGDSSFLLVDYEFVPDDFSPDNLTIGARGKHWITDNIAVGGTYVQEGRGTEDYQLAGVDVTLQRGLGTYINIEVAQSEASQAEGFFSDNGGLSFQQLSATSDLDREGDAIGVTARVNLREQGITESNWDIGAWWRNTEDGFSTARRDLGEELTEQGIEVNGEINDNLRIGARATSVEQGTDIEDEQISIILSYSLRDNDELSAEIRRIRERNTINPDTVSATLGALRYTLALTNFVELYGQVQFTLDDDDGLFEDNNSISIGARTSLTDKTTFNAELTSGDRGEAALIGLDYRRSERHSIFGTFTHSTDTTQSVTNGDRFTLGNRLQVSNQTTIFTENQFVESRTGSGIAHAFGIDYQPYEGFTIGATLQTGELQALTGVVDRDAVTVSAGASRDNWQWRSVVEFRSDNGAEDVTQWLTSNRLNYKLSDSFQLIGRLNFSDSDDQLSEFNDARFTEAGLGFAYRPTHNDRWNLIGKYTFLFDLNSPGQIDAGTDQRSNILALESIYRISPRWKVGGKLARRESELRAARGEGEFFESTANFAAIRGRYHLISSWEGLLEFRLLDVTEDESVRSGFLFSVDKHLGNNFKLGVGYNFTDFSDDLSILDYDQQGWFINAVGKY